MVKQLAGRGVEFVGKIKDDEQAGIRTIFLPDPDGTPLYLCEQTRRW